MVSIGDKVVMGEEVVDNWKRCSLQQHFWSLASFIFLYNFHPPWIHRTGGVPVPIIDDNKMAARIVKHHIRV
jgi:hypothetical protein